MKGIFTIDEIVQLVGLTSNQLLNGAVGTIAEDIDESRGRYAINLKSLSFTFMITIKKPVVILCGN
jgi:hypothetical protein